MSTIETDDAANVAGWYGKLPCLGDFASRRLSQDFIAPWDAWLQRSIATSRQQLGEQWLEIYLTSPMWRFIVAPGVCGERGWIGVLLPSVDKVGRYFPLTLALPLESDADVVALLGVQAWFAGLERIGLAALNVDYSANELEAALASHPFPALAEPSMPPERDVRGWFMIAFRDAYQRWFKGGSFVKEISTYYDDEFRRRTKPDATVKAKAQELAQGAASDAEKLERLYVFCQTKIENFDYFDSAELQAAKKKLGDERDQWPKSTLARATGGSEHINELFASMARALGGRSD